MITYPTICFVIPYFGKWPFWIPFFFASCRKNETVNWLLYTDCSELDDIPKNVKVVHISFSDYCEKVSHALNINFLPSTAYKLCDIKPALGFIHSEELVDYDFWAFGDIDVIYGNLRSYFSLENLRDKDLYTTHDRRIAGHLCLIRNNETMRNSFMRVKNWRELLTTEQHVAFDEKAYSKVFLKHKNSKLLKSIAMLFNPWLRRGEFIERYSTPNARIKWLDGSYEFPENWFWIDGMLTNDLNQNVEFMYLHFMIWKKGWKEDSFNPSILQGKKIEKFKISASGIYVFE